jgi:hypothetical protein
MCGLFRVYFIMYRGSVEEQAYLTSLRYPSYLLLYMCSVIASSRPVAKFLFLTAGYSRLWPKVRGLQRDVVYLC